MGKFKRWFVIPALALAVPLLLFRFVLFIGYMPTASMEPTLHKDSLIVGSRIWIELEVGDIVVFRREGKLLVKRVAAVGGDSVIHNKIELKVPDGQLYMLGNNATDSFDSRYWHNPCIPKSTVIAVICY